MVWRSLPFTKKAGVQVSSLSRKAELCTVTRIGLSNQNMFSAGDVIKVERVKAGKKNRCSCRVSDAAGTDVTKLRANY